MTAPQPTEGKRKTLDQRRAQHAWEAVIKLATERGGQRTYSDGAKEFAREAKKLPMRIMASGLGTALSFVLAKAKNKKPALLKLDRTLTAWVIGERLAASARVSTSLMESLIHGDTQFLRRATDETMAYLQWLNRFAEAEGLGDGEDN